MTEPTPGNHATPPSESSIAPEAREGQATSLVHSAEASGVAQAARKPFYVKVWEEAEPFVVHCGSLIIGASATYLAGKVAEYCLPESAAFVIHNLVVLVLVVSAVCWAYNMLLTYFSVSVVNSRKGMKALREHEE